MKLQKALDELAFKLTKSMECKKYENGWKDFSPLIITVATDYFEGNNSEKVKMNIWGGLSLKTSVDIVVEVETPFGKTTEKVAEIKPNILWDKRCTVKAKCKIIDFSVIAFDIYKDVEVVDLQQKVSYLKKDTFLKKLNERKLSLENKLTDLKNDINKINDWII